MGAPPLFLMLPMTFAASLGFMLPAATPPNALALGTGHVRASQMATAGLIANVVGLALIVLACYLLGFPVFGVKV
jgi:sodium-dependent dicarboxylate transporter 2/3/5